jgi:hypothetical protein
MLRACSGNNQFETREKDFFFRRGGWGGWRTRGRGGGSGRFGEVEGLGKLEGEDDWDWGGVVKAADASVNDFRRVGMWTVFEGAVLGRWSALGRETRAAKEGWGLIAGGVGMGSGVC